MLHIRIRHLQPTGTTNTRVRYITIPSNLIWCINYHNSLFIIICQNPCYFSATTENKCTNLINLSYKSEMSGRKWQVKQNLMMVVFPTPGGPISKSEVPSLTMSCNKIALPVTARPTRHVRPIIVPLRFLIALILWRVRLMPARLSAPKSPT